MTDETRALIRQAEAFVEFNQNRPTQAALNNLIGGLVAALEAAEARADEAECEKQAPPPAGVIDVDALLAEAEPVITLGWRAGEVDLYYLVDRLAAALRQEQEKVRVAQSLITGCGDVEARLQAEVARLTAALRDVEVSMLWLDEEYDDATRDKFPAQWALLDIVRAALAPKEGA